MGTFGKVEWFITPKANEIVQGMIEFHQKRRWVDVATR